MADWTLTRRPSELDILVERPGVPGPVAIVRVAPPFDEAMWAAAERFAERIAAGEAGLPGNDEIARLTRERAAMRGYFAALLIRLTRTEVERDEARAEVEAYRKAKSENDERFMNERDTARRERDDLLDEVERLRALHDATRSERDEALAERDEARCRIELAVDEMDRLRGVEQRTLDELRAEVEERDEARSQLALAMEWGRQLADHHDEHATRSEREERAELERDHARAEVERLREDPLRRGTVTVEAPVAACWCGYGNGIDRHLSGCPRGGDRG